GLARLAQPVDALALEPVSAVLLRPERSELLQREEVAIARDDGRLLRRLLLPHPHGASLFRAVEDIAGETLLVAVGVADARRPAGEPADLGRERAELEGLRQHAVDTRSSLGVDLARAAEDDGGGGRRPPISGVRCYRRSSSSGDSRSSQSCWTTPSSPASSTDSTGQPSWPAPSRRLRERRFATTSSRTRSKAHAKQRLWSPKLPRTG